ISQCCALLPSDHWSSQLSECDLYRCSEARPESPIRHMAAIAKPIFSQEIRLISTPPRTLFLNLARLVVAGWKRFQPIQIHKLRQPAGTISRGLSSMNRIYTSPPGGHPLPKPIVINPYEAADLNNSLKRTVNS